MNIYILGCGDLGRRVALRYGELGQSVRGVVRSRSSAEQLHAIGVDALVSDLDQPPLPDLSLGGSSLFYFVPPPPSGSVDTRIGNLIDTFAEIGAPRRLVYLSTTGVYGDCGGEWVDEQRQPRPVVPRALRRWDAEQSVRHWSRKSGCQLVVLRVAGFYGPGRLPLQRLREGLPLVCEEEAPFSNRIHIDDLVSVCVAAMTQGRSGELYNVSDGHPTTMTDYFDRIADLAGLRRPPKISLEQAKRQLSPGILSYLQESRRLCNHKMLKELEIELKYPDLACGLASCFPDF